MWIIHVQMHQDSSGVTEIFLKKTKQISGSDSPVASGVSANGVPRLAPPPP